MEIFARFRWILAVMLLLITLILVGWGLSSIARDLFDRSEPAPTAEVVEYDLSGVDTVKFTVVGPVVASADHESYTIEASDKVVSMKVFSDYGQKQIAAKSYKNNIAAFDNLVESIEKAGGLKRVAGTDTDDDYNDLGACPTGKRYVLEIDDDIRRWATSCVKKEGTASAKMSVIKSIFEKQITDYKELTKDTKLNRR